MPYTTKLTLSADSQVIEKAKRLARMRRTSVSAMFAKFVESLDEPPPSQPLKMGPLTRQVAGLIKLPKDQNIDQLRLDALREKYGIDK